MPRIVLARAYNHEQIEFPAGTPRPEGRRGGGDAALHLRRGKVRDVTPEELDFIRSHNPQLFAALDVLPEPTKSRRAGRLVAAEAARAARVGNAEEVGTETKAPSGSSSRRKRTSSATG